MTDEAIAGLRQAKNTNIKINTLFGLATLMIITCLAIIVFVESINSDAKALIILVCGRFLGYLDNIYHYETGTTRQSVKAEETIKELAKTTVPLNMPVNNK